MSSETYSINPGGLRRCAAFFAGATIGSASFEAAHYIGIVPEDFASGNHVAGLLVAGMIGASGLKAAVSVRLQQQGGNC